jgi:uncharacterized protein YkwD
MRFETYSRALSSAVLMAIMLALVGSGSAAAAPADPGTAAMGLANTASGYRPAGQECVFLSLINSYRKKNGVGALTMTRTLGAAAEHHSVDMARSGVFSHTMSNGVSWSKNMSNHGYTYNTYRGENIAAGYASAQDTFNQWRNSKTHNANMLNRNFKAIGIGQVANSNSKWTYYWTTDFGGVVDRAIGC